MENLFFIALVAVVGLIRWFVQAAENKKNAEAAKRAQPSPSAPLPRAPAETEEERIRRFMEALGVPKGAVPPRRVTPRTPRKILPVDPFPIPQARGLLAPVAPAPKAADAPAPLPLPTPQTSMQARSVSKSAPPSAYAVDEQPHRVVEVSRSATQRGAVPTAPAISTGIAARLAAPEGLRDAIVLREIFGPPRSMQAFNRALQRTD